MKAYAVVKGNEVVFVEFHRFRVASYIIPDANLLNDNNPLANKKWEKLAMAIGNLNPCEYFQYGEYSIFCDNVPDKVVRKDIEISVEGGRPWII